MPAAKFKPFQNDEQAVSVGGLEVENGTDRIALHGSLDIARDQTGLKQAKALRDLLAAIVTALEAEGDLPAKAAPQVEEGAVKKVKNPFG
ncbi:MAG TPA: hypothetical protein VED40_14810 [Azospirillaceae bacterium]|nr:hypothetical protein [Azospirillaceae bacterium]